MRITVAINAVAAQRIPGLPAIGKRPCGYPRPSVGGADQPGISPHEGEEPMCWRCDNPDATDEDYLELI